MLGAVGGIGLAVEQKARTASGRPFTWSAVANALGRRCGCGKAGGGYAMGGGGKDWVGCRPEGMHGIRTDFLVGGWWWTIGRGCGRRAWSYHSPTPRMRLQVRWVSRGRCKVARHTLRSWLGALPLAPLLSLPLIKQASGQGDEHLPAQKAWHAAGVYDSETTPLLSPPPSNLTSLPPHALRCGCQTGERRG